MKKLKMLMLCLLASIMGAKAQIGYQISLLNTATGEPRANETVTVSVSLSNSENKVFYSETKSATTNDFGVLSLSIGNADTFKDADFTKMPFFIEVTANGVAIGKSQILSVPVAEYAKRTGTLSKEMLVGTWVREYDYTDKRTLKLSSFGIEAGTCDYTIYEKVRQKWVFNSDGTCKSFDSNKSWTIGLKKLIINYEDYNSYEIVNDDHIYETNNEEEYRYLINGNEILLFNNANGKIPGIFSNESSPYVNFGNSGSISYIEPLGILGYGFTKR